MEYQFPDGFLWGSSTAAHQVEGNNINSDFWAEEHAEDSPYRDKSGDAVDHYRLYEQDIALMAKLGWNAYRFSIEWARVEPEPGEYSRSVIEHYRAVLECCHKAGLTPIVAMHHFSSPQWLMRLGGWNSPELPERFANYCETVFSELGPLIPYALTMNEVNLPVMLKETFATIGFIPPVGIEREAWTAPQWRESAARLCGTTADRYTTFHMASNEDGIAIIKAAHEQARRAIKRVSPTTQVGWSMALSDIQSVPGGEETAALKWNHYFEQYLSAMQGDDFFGLQNYTREVYGPDGQLKPEGETTQMGYEFCPSALGNVIRKVSAAIDLPILVTEHGIATADDTRRQTYIQEGLGGLQVCVKEGIDVRGYMHWSTFDNFEWNSGYSMHFGLIAVDRATQERTPKPSAYLLGQIAKQGSLVVG